VTGGREEGRHAKEGRKEVKKERKEGRKAKEGEGM
jgi:hypothetical protein